MSTWRVRDRIEVIVAQGLIESVVLYQAANMPITVSQP